MIKYKRAVLDKRAAFFASENRDVGYRQMAMLINWLHLQKNRAIVN